jgi:glycosyltransferase involved in cell wall biosynthesis
MVHLQRIRDCGEQGIAKVTADAVRDVEDTRSPAAPRAGLLIVMPALNEAASVAAVVREVQAAQPSATVLVVDDGSVDATAERAFEAGAQVMSLPFNLGVGGAMRAAYRYADDAGFSQVVQVDADGQHDPRHIAELLETAGTADIIIGARFAGCGDYRLRGPRRWAIRLLAAVLSRVTKTRITDPTSGFRLINDRALAVFARHYPEEYLGDTVEALVIAHRVGLSIAQVPVAMRPRQSGRASQHPLRASAFLLRVMVAIALALVRRVPQPGGASLRRKMCA